MQEHDIQCTDHYSQCQVQPAATAYLTAGNTCTDNGKNKTRERLCGAPVFFYKVEVEVFAPVQLLFSNVKSSGRAF